MQQNFSESVKPRAETFSRSAIGCITTKCTPEEIVPQGRRTPHMRGIFPHPDRGGAPRRGKGSKISLKKAISQTEPPAAEKMPGSTPPPTRAASPPTPSGQHSALRSGSIAGTPPRAARRRLGTASPPTLQGSTQRSARATSPAHLPGLHTAAPPRAAARQPTRPWRGGSRRPCSSRRA